MPGARKCRFHPQHCAVADRLRDAYYYHVPDGPMPTRQVIIDLSLRRGLRSLHMSVAQRTVPEAHLPYVPVAEYDRVRVDDVLLDFADRLRGSIFDLLRVQDGEATYPSRTYVITTALDLGLREMRMIYRHPRESDHVQLHP